MTTNRETKLWDDWDSTKNEKTEVLFATEVKNIREKLVRLAIQAQVEYRRLNSRKQVIGFEYKGVVETPENLHALKEDLAPMCGDWPKIAHRQLSATILFGRNFQEILVFKRECWAVFAVPQDAIQQKLPCSQNGDCPQAYSKDSFIPRQH